MEEIVKSLIQSKDVFQGPHEHQRCGVNAQDEVCILHRVRGLGEDQKSHHELDNDNRNGFGSELPDEPLDPDHDEEDEQTIRIVHASSALQR